MRKYVAGVREAFRSIGKYVAGVREAFRSIGKYVAGVREAFPLWGLGGLYNLQNTIYNKKNAISRNSRRKIL
jgi:hypothetical protein